MMGAGNDNQASEDTKEKEMLEKSQKEDYHFHAWVYVDMVESSGFFIEATSGVRKPLNHPSYKSINSAWNHENYWLNKECDEEWKNAKSLDLMDETKWIRFVCDMELPKKNIEVVM